MSDAKKTYEGAQTEENQLADVLNEFLADQETMNEPYRNEAICEVLKRFSRNVEKREVETPDPKAEAYRKAARDRYEIEGECETDEDAPVSIGDAPGAWVQAWVWVSLVDSIIEDPDEICECGRDPQDCATSEGADVHMDRDDYIEELSK